MASTQSVFSKIKWQFTSGEVQQMSNGGHLPGWLWYDTKGEEDSLENFDDHAFQRQSILLLTYWNYPVNRYHQMG